MSPDKNDRHARLVSVIAEILEIDPSTVRGTSRLREDLGMDSLHSLELLSVLSHELQIELEMEEAMQISTVNDAFAFLEKHYQSQHGEAAANV